MASLDIAATPAPDTSAPATGRSIELFESAMCCETGVCGPSVDQQLITVREDLRWAQEQGATVSRHSLTSDPDAFVASQKVTGLMQAFGEQVLPVLVIDGAIAVHGRYPSRDELVGVPASQTPAEEPKSAGGCGCGPGGC